MRQRLIRPSPGATRCGRFILGLVVTLALNACASGEAMTASSRSVSGEEASVAQAGGAIAPRQQRLAAIDSASGSTILLEDEVWQGGFRQPDGSLAGGRSAIWLGGANSAGSVIATTFRVDGRPIGNGEITIVGMETPGGRAPLTIQINDIDVYRGPALPHDTAVPWPEGNWTEATYSFDAGALQPGINRIAISVTLSEDDAERPSFAIDYVEIIYESQAP